MFRNILKNTPLRLIAIPLALLVGALAWLVLRLFPSMNQHHLIPALAFGLALVFAFALGGRSRTRKSSP
jgi:hypothetical protein